MRDGPEFHLVGARISAVEDSDFDDISGLGNWQGTVRSGWAICGFCGAVLAFGAAAGLCHPGRQGGNCSGRAPHSHGVSSERDLVRILSTSLVRQSGFGAVDDFAVF